MKAWKRATRFWGSGFLVCAIMSLILGNRGVDAAKAFNLLVPDASRRVYSNEEIGMLPLVLTNYAKNEIYARHGRKFQSKELQDYFGEQPWYQPSIETSDFDENMLNANEKENARLLKNRENMLSHDGNGYQLDQTGYKDRADAALLAYFSDDYNIFEGFSNHMSSGWKVVNTDHFTLSIPGEPSTMVVQLDRRSFAVCYARAKENGMGGRVVTIRAYDNDDPDNDYSSYPSWKICGSNDRTIFVALYPTDVQYDFTDFTQKNEYAVLQNWADTLDSDSSGGGSSFWAVEETEFNFF